MPRRLSRQAEISIKVRQLLEAKDLSASWAVDQPKAEDSSTKLKERIFTHLSAFVKYKKMNLWTKFKGCSYQNW